MHKKILGFLALTFFCFLFFFVGRAEAKVPVVRILVAQYNDKIDFVMPEGGIWQLGKRGSGEIKPGVAYSISGKLSSPSRRRFHLMVATVDLLDDLKLVDLTEKYEKMGFKTHRISVGEASKHISMPDNRVVHLGIDKYDDKEKAEAKKVELAAKGILTWIYIENIDRASGMLEISGDGQKFTASLSGTEGYALKAKNGVILKKVEHSKGYSWHGFEDRKYLGKLIVNFGFDDCLDCIEETDLEKMLVGVVPSEISSKAPKAAIEAQAVAARGEILSKRGLRHVNSGFDFCAEQHCQVYKGYQRIAPTIAENIKDTFGKVLMMKKSNKILDVVYCANCGGHTSSNHKIWISQPNPHLQGISDERKTNNRDLTKEKDVTDYILNPPMAWCNTKGFEGSDKYRWIKRIDSSEWEKIEKNANLGQIKDIAILSREVSGRIIRLRVIGSLKSLVLINELEIRRFFGGLRSSCFVAEYEKDAKGFVKSAVIKGAGFGHGVGMCQSGAQAMAGAGYVYKLILEHYFPNARLVSVY